MKTKIFLVILICFLLYTSCSKDKGCDGTAIEYENLSQANKNLIPYKGGETLTFLHKNTGDTITFIGESKWTSYSNSSFSGSDCVKETKLEGRGIAFSGVSNNKSIVLNQYISSSGTMYFEINFDNLFINTAYLWSTSPYQKIQDSITIQSKKYYDIFFYSDDNIKPQPNDYGCYYTRKDGIIKLFTKTGDSWELISKN
jgi:hypothetical protein